MPDSELEQIYQDAEFMMDACGESRRTCRRQQGMLAAQRERAAHSCERQTGWTEKQAREDELLYEALTEG
ncbi:MAG TPA: hypothetical protein VD861_19720 [Pyrinomonadaceae bacterium]|nr:hypothetical protein [Pyrinomonadaceae bacterium]